ncbi:MAG: hypothetical protein J5I65_16415 [Aridibacter famidurans]|nr:hypothetical protein [Aridibacter famidurans]
MTKGIGAYRVNANYYPLHWIEGEPRKRSFLGIKGQNLDVSGSELREVTAFRCRACGFVESYAW